MIDFTVFKKIFMIERSKTNSASKNFVPHTDANASSQPTGRKVHVSSQDLLFCRGPKKLNALLFPYREICTHRTSSRDPLSVLIGESDFATSRV
jgi:hypothetical protein